jgi:hypothetical protein
LIVKISHILRVCEKRALRRTFGPKTEELGYKMRIFIICTRYYYDDKIGRVSWAGHAVERPLGRPRWK